MQKALEAIQSGLTVTPQSFSALFRFEEHKARDNGNSLESRGF